MKNNLMTFVAMLACIFCAITATSGAQETEKAPDQNQNKQQPSPVKAYHLEFSLHEMQNGKTINTRHYSIDLNEAAHFSEIKIGTRVPVTVGDSLNNNQFQYMDVGTSISPRLEDHPNGLALIVHADISNFAIPDQGSVPARPIVRQISIDGSTIVTLNKAVMIGSMDDPNSDHQFQLEATVTKLN